MHTTRVIIIIMNYNNNYQCLKWHLQKLFSFSPYLMNMVLFHGGSTGLPN